MRAKIFIQYLLERFQLIPLSILVWSDVLVIDRVTELGTEVSVGSQVAVFFMVIFYLFSNRVGDDRRDFKFDQQYHEERALQQGLLSLRFLEVLGYLALGGMLVLATFFGKTSLLLVIPVWLFSLWAKYDFSLPPNFKEKRFYLYNVLNMSQMLLLQVFVYCSLINSFDLTPVMWLHIAFVFVLSLQVEVTRKVKPVKTAGNDQYSDRMGMGNAVLLWSALGLIAFACYLFLARSFCDDMTMVYGIGGLLMIYMLLTGGIYLKKRSPSYENLFWSGMILAYVGQNLILAYA